MANSDAIEADAQRPSCMPNPAPAVVSDPVLVGNIGTPQAEADTCPPSVLPDTIPFPNAAPAPVPSPNPSDLTQPVLFKNHLHEYAQKLRIPLPVYQTVNEGSQNAPKCRSTVLVDEVYYVSPNMFRNRREAEQDAARIALEYISKKTKEDGFLLLHEDLMFCKSILSEYTDKMSMKRPMYTTKQHIGSVPIFQSTLVFDGVVYTSDVSRSKKEAEQLAARSAILSLLGNPKSQKILVKIIASKVRLHATLQKVKDSHPSQIQPKPMSENTEQHLGMAVNEDKEVKDAILVNGVVSSAISEASPTMSRFQPEFRSTKPEASSDSVRLPIEFVPSTLEEPAGDHVTGAKKRSKNKKKADKKLRTDNRIPTGTSQTAPPPP